MWRGSKYGCSSLPRMTSQGRRSGVFSPAVSPSMSTRATPSKNKKNGHPTMSKRTLEIDLTPFPPALLRQPAAAEMTMLFVIASVAILAAGLVLILQIGGRI